MKRIARRGVKLRFGTRMQLDNQWRARAMSGVIIAIFGVTFVISAVLVRRALDVSARRQESISAARLARARLLELQLDQEASERGYIVDGSYSAHNGDARWANALRGLLADLRRIDPSITHYVDQEQVEHLRWVRDAPLGLYPGKARVPPHADTKQLRDVARFRALDAQIASGLEQAGRASDARSAALINRIFAWSLILGCAVVTGALGVAAFFIKARNEVEAKQRAYEEEKRLAEMMQRWPHT